MKSYAQNVYVVDWSGIFDKFPEIKEKYDKFMEVYEEYRGDEVYNIQEIEDNYENLPLDLKKTYNDFLNIVQEKTNMVVYPQYHNPDEGDAGDDIQGEFWCCVNAIIPNPEIDNHIFENCISNASFTVLA